MQIDRMRIASFAGTIALFGAFGSPVWAETKSSGGAVAGSGQAPIVVAQGNEQRGGGGGGGRATGAPGGGGGGGPAIRAPGGGGGEGRAVGAPDGGGGGRGVVRGQGREGSPTLGGTERRRGTSEGFSGTRRDGGVYRGDRRVRPDVGGGGRGGNRPWRAGRQHNWGGSPFYFWNGYYYGDCQWLKRRAAATGSRYWLRRYRLCRAGY